MATFLARVQALFPFIPRPLQRVYAQAWAQTGSQAEALAAMRDDPRYDQFFAGNRRADGTLRHGERQYVAVVDGYKQNLAARGINPALFNRRYASWIEGDVSVAEQGERLQAWDEQLANWGPRGKDGYSEAATWYAEHYGVEPTRQAILVAAMDPELGQDIFLRRVSMAQVGGVAAYYGFDRSAARVSALQGLGVTGDTARELYARAASDLPVADAIARRFNDDQGVDIADFEDALAGADPDTRMRLARNLARERASFSSTAGVRQDTRGGLSGLRPT